MNPKFMPDFSPLPFLSGPMAQSFLASYKSKTDVRLGVPKDSVWKLIRTPEQVSLLSLWNECPNPKGYILMIHGWEGSHLSSYMVRTKQFFLREGYSIIRLNLRDHGETHHLNEGLFNGSLLQETYSAVYEISKMIPKGMPLFLLGFSLGGNFVLRIAKSHSESPKQKQIQNLKHSFSISPALDPLAA
ncbi:serine aminopeptidase domain-containing protein, partial [Leptospira ryugenii]